MDPLQKLISHDFSKCAVHLRKMKDQGFGFARQAISQTSRPLEIFEYKVFLVDQNGSKDGKDMTDEDDVEFVNLDDVDVKDFGGKLSDVDFRHFDSDLDMNL